MKCFALYALVFIVCCGFTVVQSPKGASQTFAIYQPWPPLMISWNPNYDRQQEVTLIQCATNIANHTWSTYFIGHTNRCGVWPTNRQMFFRANTSFNSN